MLVNRLSRAIILAPCSVDLVGGGASLVCEATLVLGTFPHLLEIALFAAAFIFRDFALTPAGRCCLI